MYILTHLICCWFMTKAEPGVMQLGQSVTAQGIGPPTFDKELGISDFMKYSWRLQTGQEL